MRKESENLGWERPSSNIIRFSFFFFEKNWANLKLSQVKTLFHIFFSNLRFLGPQSLKYINSSLTLILVSWIFRFNKIYTAWVKYLWKEKHFFWPNKLILPSKIHFLNKKFQSNLPLETLEKWLWNF